MYDINGRSLNEFMNPPSTELNDTNKSSLIQNILTVSQTMFMCMYPHNLESPAGHQLCAKVTSHPIV